VPSRQVRERVARARQAQLGRQGKPNARLSGSEAVERAQLDARGRMLLREAVATLRLSARAHDRALKVARTIADLEGAVRVAPAHVAESLRYRGFQPRP
jgi:magnesium chelatase family protein